MAAQVLWILQGPHGGQILQIAQTVDVFSRYGVIFMLFLMGLDTRIFTSYSFVMVLAWLANLVGLATIIGAFTYGPRGNVDSAPSPTRI